MILSKESSGKFSTKYFIFTVISRDWKQMNSHSIFKLYSITFYVYDDMIGMHIVQLFVQYAPYDVSPSVGTWSDEAFKNAFADRVCAIVDEYAPGERRHAMR